ncbi:MAG: DUF3450 domain-containing protein [Acidimicrobiales bacterium]|nr:MAG: DUF3450 domain-containing protein [Acidimicrobiales bacterium]
MRNSSAEYASQMVCGAQLLKLDRKENMSNISIAKHLLLAGAAVLALSAPAHAQLEEALRTAKSSTAASAASQARVEQNDDEAESAIREYRAVLQQIDNIQLFVDKQDIYLNSQAKEIASLNNQLGNVENIKRGMVPMMLRMTAEIEDSVESDMPFLMNERRARIQRLKDVLSNPEVSPAEQYRQVLNTYKIEVSYGQGLDSYEGAHPTKEGMKVDYLRYGRLALVYMTKDEKDIGYYDLGSKSWKPVPGNQALSVRQAIRVANEEAAPEVVMAPMTGAK